MGIPFCTLKQEQNSPTLSMLAAKVMNIFLKQNIQNIRQIAGIPSGYLFPLNRDLLSFDLHLIRVSSLPVLQ
jgi:hypothetical protein